MRLFQLIILVICLGGFACRNVEKESAEEKHIQDSVAFYTKNLLTDFPGEPGIVGLFDVPEMLALCRMDSAPVKDISSKIKESFAALDEDLKLSGSELNGPQGIIYYNNNPENFIFECVLLIKKIPAKTPEQSKVTMLEADKMVLFNYYGPYENTYTAYSEIKTYCDAHNLKQSGPMREFYASDALTEPDSSKWLTRILVPVTLEKGKK